MPSLTNYRGLDVPSVDPSGEGGLAIANDLKHLVDWSPKSNYGASADPGPYDDLNAYYYPGSLWLNNSSSVWFICVSSGAGSAVWARLTWFPMSPTSSVMMTDGSGYPTAGGATSTELGYLSGASSNIQSQLNSIGSTASTAASDATTALANAATANANATAAGTAAASAASAAASAASEAATANSNASTANAAAAAASAAVTTLSASLAPVATSGAYSSLSGLPTIPTATSQLTNDSGFVAGTGFGGTGTYTSFTIANGMISSASSPVTATELGYLAGVTSGIQAQLDSKLSGTYTASRAIVSNSSGAIVVSAATDTEVGYLSGVTSAIQTQLNSIAATASAADSTASAAGAAASSASSTASAASSAVSSLSASLAPVATSGAYSSLTGTPTIPTLTSQLTNDSGFMVGSNNLSELSNLTTARYTLFGNNSPVADGTYTVGIGTTQNGTITIVNGLITAIQQAI